MNNLPATILIVDDEVQNRKLLEALLLPEGYLTVSVSSGMEALEQVAASAPDLILLDIMMPQMNGYEVVTRLKANPVTSSIPVIMITAQIDRNARVAGLHAGAEEFLTKPVDRIELWLRIRNLLRLKAYSDLLRDQGALLEAQVQARTLELQRFRTAMDASGDGIFLASRAQLRLVEANATLWRMLGCSRAELLQASPALFAGTLRMDLAEFYDAIIADPMGTALCETTLMQRDTTEVQVEVRLTAQRSGQDWLIIGAVRDISERKAAEQRLHHLAHYDALTGLPNRTLYYEIMARILFGNSIGELSAIQAVQLAASLNNLRGGSGGLNPLSVLQSAAGLNRLRILGADQATGREMAVAFGQYITNDVYVEIVTDARGYTATQLEISLTPALSVLSQIGTTGTSNVNVRYKKDY